MTWGAPNARMNPAGIRSLRCSSWRLYGINVSELAASSGMKYINGQNTVTYFGALLFCEA